MKSPGYVLQADWCNLCVPVTGKCICCFCLGGLSFAFLALLYYTLLNKAESSVHLGSSIAFARIASLCSLQIGVELAVVCLLGVDVV